MSNDFYRAAADDLVNRVRDEYQQARYAYRASVRGNPVQYYAATNINIDGFLSLHRKKQKFGGDKEVIVYDALQAQAVLNKPLLDSLQGANIDENSYRAVAYTDGTTTTMKALAIIILESEPIRRARIENAISGFMQHEPHYRAKATLIADITPC